MNRKYDIKIYIKLFARKRAMQHIGYFHENGQQLVNDPP